MQVAQRDATTSWSEANAHTRFERESVAPGETCQSQDQVQECVGAGALTDWKAIGGRSGGARHLLILHVRISCAKCEPRMRFDDICDLHCNTPACDFDNGKCAAAARRHLDDGYLMMKVGSKKAKANALSSFEPFCASDVFGFAAGRSKSVRFQRQRCHDGH